MECESFWHLPFGVHIEQEITTDQKGKIIEKKNIRKGTEEEVKIN